MAKHLLDENAHICIYDPKVSETQIRFEMEHLVNNNDDPNRCIDEHCLNYFRRNHSTASISVSQRGGMLSVNRLVTVYSTPYEAAKDAHAIVVMTEWDEFKVVSLL